MYICCTNLYKTVHKLCMRNSVHNYVQICTFTFNVPALPELFRLCVRLGFALRCAGRTPSHRHHHQAARSQWSLPKIFAFSSPFPRLASALFFYVCKMLSTLNVMQAIRNVLTYCNILVNSFWGKYCSLSRRTFACDTSVFEDSFAILSLLKKYRKSISNELCIVRY